MMFKIFENPLEKMDLESPFSNTGAGGFVSFEGWVRSENEGQQVMVLEYEAYTELAEKEGERILIEARDKFDIIGARCGHRVGRLQLGDMAVWVGVSAAHRNEAFQACRYVIDEVKRRVPIWKKEYYKSGDSGWLCPVEGYVHAPPERDGESTSTA